MAIPRTHPFLLVRADGAPGLLSLQALRDRASHPRARDWFDRFRQAADRMASEAPLVAREAGPDGPAVEMGNAGTCVRVRNTVRSLALAALIWEQPDHLAAAWRYIDTLLDDKLWPRWGGSRRSPVDMRSGIVAQTIAFPYDWLHPYLTEAQRHRVVAGLDKRVIQPFKIVMAERPYPIDRRNNQCTVVCGSMGVVAMALADEHPDVAAFLPFCDERMRWVLDVCGPDGEFNESPGYTDSMPTQVEYFEAKRFFTDGQDTLPTKLHQLTQWSMYAMSPPADYVNHGDSGGGGMRYWYVPAIANVDRDGVLQWFYESMRDHQKQEPRVLELLSWDPDLSPTPPTAAHADQWPLGKAYAAWGALASSRSDWAVPAPASAVFGKASIEMCHEHNDAGQVLLFGRGRPLIVDDMMHTYPGAYWDAGRYRYLFSSAKAHNIMTFGEFQPDFTFPDTVKRGRLINSEFDNQRGGWWTVDLSEPDRGLSVFRTVIHLLPDVMVVLDDATCAQEEDITLRWHTRFPPTMHDDTTGLFSATCEDAAVAAGVFRLDAGDLNVTREMWPLPECTYDRWKVGGFPYVSAATLGTSLKLLSLFAVCPSRSTGDDDLKHNPPTWRRLDGDRFVISTTGGQAEVAVSDGTLLVSCDSGNWTVQTPSCS